MKEYIEKLKEERDELQSRLSSLCEFVLGDKFTTLNPAYRILLEQQKEVMQKYRDILDIRIEMLELNYKRIWDEEDANA